MTAVDDEQGFDERIAAYRAELLAHCYRMLGSVHEAEDLVQETLLRAWRARDQYDETRSSLRTWLYRIATNACLTALASDKRRPLPSGLVAESDPLRPFTPGHEVPWLQPLPDALLDAGDPARTAVDRGSLRLAFMAALQHLSARQRAVLILRDVLDFSAAETAEIIGLTTIAVNSSLRRARTSVQQSGADPEGRAEATDAEQRAWIERYLSAFVTADVEGLKRLLADDVLMEMPPMLNWFVGKEAYGVFMARIFAALGTDWRFVPLAANGQLGYAAYRGDGDRYHLHTVQLFEMSAIGITRTTVYQDEEVFASFGLAVSLDP